MTEGIYFADAELPFHVWVRQRTGNEGFRWVLREARSATTGAPAEADAPRAPDGDAAPGEPGREP